MFVKHLQEHIGQYLSNSFTLFFPRNIRIINLINHTVLYNNIIVCKFVFGYELKLKMALISGYSLARLLEHKLLNLNRFISTANSNY